MALPAFRTQYIWFTLLGTILGTLLWWGVGHSTAAAGLIHSFHWSIIRSWERGSTAPLDLTD
eukprot:3192938-Rhodomonas_salina.1